MRKKVKLKDLVYRKFLFYKEGTKWGDKIPVELNKKIPKNEDKLITGTLLEDPQIKKRSWISRTMIRYQLWKNIKYYDWDKLKKNMDSGYDPNLDVILVTHPRKWGKNLGKNVVVDGNHRCNLLEEMYGDEYELEVEAVSFIRSECETTKVKNIVKWYKSLFTDKIILITSLKLLMVIIYMAVLNFKYFVGVITVLLFYAVFNLLLKAVKYHPQKIANNLPIKNMKVKKIVMNFISNIPGLVVIAPMAIIVIKLIINNPIQFCIFGFVIYILESLEEKYKV